MLLGLRIELPQLEAGLCSGCDPPGIYTDCLHGRQIDHEAILQDGLPHDIVSAAANRNRDIMLSCETYCLCYITCVATTRNERGLAVDHAVVDLPRLVEVGMCPRQDATGQTSFESVEYRRSDHLRYIIAIAM